jgi:hypothetical protein
MADLDGCHEIRSRLRIRLRFNGSERWLLPLPNIAGGGTAMP